MDKPHPHFCFLKLQSARKWIGFVIHTNQIRTFTAVEYEKSIVQFDIRGHIMGFENETVRPITCTKLVFLPAVPRIGV